MAAFSKWFWSTGINREISRKPCCSSVPKILSSWFGFKVLRPVMSHMQRIKTALIYVFACRHISPAPRVVFICLGGRFHNNLSAHPSPSTPHGSDYDWGMQHVSPLTLKHPCVPAALRPSALLHPSHSPLRQITPPPPTTSLQSSVYSTKSSNHFYPHKQRRVAGMLRLITLFVCRRSSLDKSLCITWITWAIWCFSDTLIIIGIFLDTVNCESLTWHATTFDIFVPFCFFAGCLPGPAWLARERFLAQGLRWHGLRRVCVRERASVQSLRSIWWGEEPVYLILFLVLVISSSFLKMTHESSKYCFCKTEMMMMILLLLSC